MNNTLKNVLIVALLAAVAGLVIYMIPKSQDDDSGNDDDASRSSQISNFITCADAGYPVMESYPAQCRTPDGRLFVEDITENAEVVILTPTQGQLVKSPLTVTGKAKGNWFFEANLPVKVTDSTGKVLVQKGAQAIGNWMTEDYVDFTVTLEFATPTTDTGWVLVEKDNPSGMPENAGQYAMPIRFR